jgi:cyclopropane-fatty-acyl-phospholipid synthase
MLHQAPDARPSLARSVLERFAPQLPTRSADAEAIVREMFGHADIQFGGTRQWDITVHDPRFYERVLRDASIGFGEAYMEGWWEVPALDVMIDKLCRGRLKEKIQGSWRLKALTVKAMLLNLQAKARAGAANEAHYHKGKHI